MIHLRAGRLLICYQRCNQIAEGGPTPRAPYVPPISIRRRGGRSSSSRPTAPTFGRSDGGNAGERTILAEDVRKLARDNWKLPEEKRAIKTLKRSNRYDVWLPDLYRYLTEPRRGPQPKRK
jgi:hypothetical protein